MSLKSATSFTLAVFALFLLVSANSSAAEGGHVNVVYILADDLGYGDLSCYGQQKFETPNIDRLAREGMRFTQHYSGSTVCAPSRCSLMTGLHTGHAYIRGNREVKPEGQWPIPDATLTLAEVFQAAGYETGMFGKWGLGAPGSEGDPMNQGFDEFFGYNCQRHAHRYYVDYLWHNENKTPVDPQSYTHDLIEEQALSFIRDNRDKPFFCYLPVTIPHAAMEVPQSEAAPFREKWPQFESLEGKYAGVTVQNPIANFAAMVTRLDKGVGRVLDLLEELGLDESTLVIFTSDNGPHLEGGHDPEFFNSNGPLRGYKRDLYEGGIRAPMIARWPGKIAPGSVSNHISANWDMLPTYAELIGASPPEGIDGISLLPTLLGDSAAQKAHEFLYWEFAPRGGKQAIRKGPWKAVRVGLATNRDAPIELYNIDNDPGETANIANQHPGVIAEMKRLFVSARSNSELFPLYP